MHNNSRQYLLFDANGQRYEVTGLKQFCKEKGLTERLMRLVVQGKRNTHQGWRAYLVDPLAVR